MTSTPYRFLFLTFITKRSTVVILIPILLLSYLIGIVYQTINLETGIFIPGEGNSTTQFLEGFLLASIAVVSGILIMIAIKYNREKVLKGIFAVGLFISSVSVFWIHGYILELLKPNLYPWIEIIFAIVGCMLGIFVFLGFISNKGNLHFRNTIIVLLGIAVGTVFGLILPLPTFLTLIILISLFDIYSVFKGPISKIFKKSNLSVSQQPNEFTIQSIAIGIGDFIFYSSFVTFVTKELGLAIGISAILGIIMGIKITERSLLKHGKFPGLPIPIFFALILSGLAWVVDHYLLLVFKP
ncbi:MAG: hypothetical protein HGN29_10220 [Asgard group archaeon]|nr:hypothetical protein [Asgard group archaeon]